ncbi:hypothetical protein CRI93_04460 [Longimonas halophila]|uniref:Uncharacterized protein n=1 Tax=Longimonas halophila TaxID=1469170 RepID=A0A2H3P8Y2_9BACT|nr:DUF4385 family protein [Longimonas halophila]PEN08371.1 hypothetical protein CRI93_04460 [Longimonas halophila]
MRIDRALPTPVPHEHIDIDFSAHPEAYRIQPNEKGVFKVEPYKSALLEH